MLSGKRDSVGSERHGAGDGQAVFQLQVSVNLDEEVKRAAAAAEDVADAVAVPPDGGWGWVVCAAGFFCNLILDGIAYSFGVLLTPLVVHFDSNESTVSWVGSLLCGMYMLSGPIVGGLVNRFGCRPVCMTGALVAFVSFSLSTLSVNVVMLMVTYGLMGGFGLGLIFLPAVICVGYYFESRRALATGISVCGSGVGAFVFAPLARHLLEVYDWKTTNLVFAGICLLCLLFGWLMRPLELTREEEPAASEARYLVDLPDGTRAARSVDLALSPSESRFLESIHEEGAAAQEENHYPVISVPVGETAQDRLARNLAAKSRRHRTQSEAPPFLQNKIARNSSTPYLRPRTGSLIPSLPMTTSMSSEQLKALKTTASTARIVRPLSRKDIFFSGSIQRLEEEGEVFLTSARQRDLSVVDLKSNKYSVLSFASQTRACEPEQQQTDSPNLVLEALKEMVQLSLLKNSQFLLISISNIFGFLGFYVPFVYLPNMAEQQEGVTRDNGAFLVSIIGISNTVGRILAGWISDFDQVNPLIINNLALVLSSVCVFLFPSAGSYPEFIAISVFFGLFVSAYISLTSIVLVNLVGLESLTSAFGLLTMFRGLASIMGPPLAGAVFQATQSYTVSFYLAGSFLLAAGLVSEAAHVLNRCRDSVAS